MQLLMNQKVVRTLAELLPADRKKVTGGMLRQLQFVTGFSQAEIFRKCVSAIFHCKHVSSKCIALRLRTLMC